MAQHDYDLANQNGAAFRADLNSALAAIQSQNSGPTEPAATVAYMPWADTNAGLWKFRNAADSAWVSVMSLTASRVDTAAGTSYDNSGSSLVATNVKDALDELDAAVTNVSGDYYSTTNILGTVSQSGGVPTGAIIQRGSNANGEYVKFADGTLICTFSANSVLTSNVATGNVFTSSSEYVWTFPIAFSETANLSTSGGTRTTTDAWIRTRTESTSAARAKTYSPSSVAAALSIELTAIGRWY